MELSACSIKLPVRSLLVALCGVFYFYTERCVQQYDVCIMHWRIVRGTALECFFVVSSDA
jgi:hypothetical protein